MTPIRRRLRKLRFLLQAVFVALVITAAVLVGFAQLALPWLADNPRRIEGWLTERLGRTVTIGKVSGMWTRAGPRLILDDLGIATDASGNAGLHLPRAELALNMYAAFQRNRAWNEFRLVGLDLSLVRNEDGAWKLLGINPAARAQDSGNTMGVLGAVVLVDLKVNVIDASRDMDLDFQIPELRVVNLGRITRVLGQIGRSTSTVSPLSLVADIDVEGGSGRLYAGGHRVDLAELISGFPVGGIKLVSANGDFEFWAEWQQARIDDMTLKIDLDETVLESRSGIDVANDLTVQPRTAFERLALGARLRRIGGDMRLDVADATVTRLGAATPPARFVIEQKAGDSSRYSIVANSLDINALANVAMLSDLAPAGLRTWLYLGNPRGRMSAMDVMWESAGNFSVDMLMDELSSSAAGAIPGISSLHGRLRGDAAALMLEVPVQATRIDYPKVFRKPFELVRFGGDILAWPDGGGWRVQTAALDVVASDYSVELRGGLHFQGDGTRPAIEMTALVQQADVQAAKLFWPVNVMPPPVVDWLDRALVSGTVVEGRAVALGDLDHWPFEDNSGRFEALAHLQGLELAFLPDWPAGEDLDVTARFINGGMQASVASGQSLGVILDATEAGIPRFKDSLLELSIDAHAKGADLLKYLRATPVGKARAEYIDGLSIGGNGQVHVQIDVPLNDNERMTLDGHVDLLKSDLVESNWDLRFDQASGRVAFSRTGVLASALQADYSGHPVMLGIAIGSSTLDPLNTFEASLQGELPTATVFARATDLVPVMPSFPGTANWLIDLQLGDEAGAARGRKSLRLQSDLQGVAMLLPAPLDKAADMPLPFSLELEMPIAGQAFSASLGGLLEVHGQLPGPLSPLAAQMNFGTEVRPADVPAKGLRIGGTLESLDVGGWIALFNAGGTGGDLLDGIVVDVRAMQMAGRDFPDLHLELAPQQDATTIRVAGQSLDGEISVPMSELGKRGITAQMNRMIWPELPEEKQDGPDALSEVDPAGIPPLHLWIGDLQLGEVRMGELRLESFPTSTGMRVELLEAKSPEFDLRADGDWNGEVGANRSHMVIDMSAPDLGSMLDAFGYAGIIQGGETFARIDATWPGAPTSFSLANTTGSLELSVDKGRILDVDPGAGGRLFGLFSLREIPRRLSLDFSDLFKSGMSFNSINGSFQLRDGSAYTDNLLINSPPADIEISGRTGLRDKDYDQKMVVTPRAGVALPVVGALAGGPVGAAAGIVVQTLIGKKINQAARSVYTVKGGWEKPDIALVKREQLDAERKAGDAAGPSADPTLAPPELLARPVEEPAEPGKQAAPEQQEPDPASASPLPVPTSEAPESDLPVKQGDSGSSEQPDLEKGGLPKRPKPVSAGQGHGLPAIPCLA